MNILQARPVLSAVAAIAVAVAIAAGCVLAEPTPAPTLDGPPPSLIFHGGRVITMEPDQPQAEAIAVRGDEIVAVGGSDRLLALAGPSTQVIDLQGRALLPGFIDAHNHLLSEAIRTGTPSLQEAQDYALRMGITAMADMSVEPPILTALRDFNDSVGLRVRTSVYAPYNLNCGEVLGHWYAEFPPERDTDLMLRVPGVKVFTDGWTCDLLPAFSVELRDAPDAAGSRGHLLLDRDELTRVLSELDEAGYQAAVHALGDRRGRERPGRHRDCPRRRAQHASPSHRAQHVRTAGPAAKVRRDWSRARGVELGGVLHTQRVLP